VFVARRADAPHAQGRGDERRGVEQGDEMSAEDGKKRRADQWRQEFHAVAGRLQKPVRIWQLGVVDNGRYKGGLSRHDDNRGDAIAERYGIQQPDLAGGMDE
jgi:hypothetical protein